MNGCPTNDELRQFLSGKLSTEAQAVLAAHIDSCTACQVNLEALTDKPSLAWDPETTTQYAKPNPPHHAAGTILADRYRLIKKIGEGGMGVVWLADQLAPIRRQVAVKLVKADLEPAAILARFQAERQALAVMDHPNIAKVLDAGECAPTALGGGGQPFFVMELVNGVPLNNFCDDQRLAVPERLKLFAQICAAIQHAHQKGIIHRDLKPSNILVEMRDGQPFPKVIDFGLAKATGTALLTEQSLFTAMGMVAGTPLYMSPEQTGGHSADIDTRADIYSLGIILFELLTGSTPIDRATLKKIAFDELVRAIREQDAPTPSSRISSYDQAASVAALRQTEPARLSRIVRGELDWIVLKALDKDRERRYESAQSFAHDIERYLCHEPVQAGPPGQLYKLRKFIRRHRLSVTAASIAFIGIIAGALAATLGWLEASRQRDAAIVAERKADDEKKVAVAVRDFLRFKLLKQADVTNQAEALVAAGASAKAAKADVTLREVLDRAAQELAQDKIETSFPNQPRVQAAVLTSVGQTYESLGDFRTAIKFLERAAQLYDQSLGKNHADTVIALHNLASAHGGAGDFTKAISLGAEVYAVEAQLFGPNDVITLKALDNLGMYYYDAGQYAKAVETHEKTRAGFAAALGPNHRTTSIAASRLAMAYNKVGRLADAIRLYEQTRAARLRSYGPDHPDTIETTHSLALAYQDARRYDEAVPLLREVVNARVTSLGPNDPSTLNAQNTLGMVLHNSGRLAEAFPLMERTVEGLSKGLGKDHPATLAARHNLAFAYADNNDLDRAIAAELDVWKDRAAKSGADHPHTLSAATLLGRCYREKGQLPEAIDWYRKVYDGSVAKLGPTNPQTIRAGANYAVILARSGKAAEAKLLAKKAVAAARKGMPIGEIAFANVIGETGLAYLLAESPAEAEPLLRESLAIRENKEPKDFKTPLTRSLLGGCLTKLGQHADAEPLLLAGYQGLQEREASMFPLNRKRIPEAIDRLIEHYTATNKPDETKKWQSELEKYPKK